MVSDATARPLRIVYFGTPDFAVASLRRLIELDPDRSLPHRVVAVVSQPDRPKGRGNRLAPTPTKALALAHSIEVLQPDRLKDETFLQRMTSLAPDVGVVAAYGRLLPESLLQIPRLGMINVHASLLPRWRGAAPIHRAVIAGDDITGVTIMRVVKELDAGAAFKAVKRVIAADDTSVEVERDLAEMGADVLVDVLDDMAEDRAKETPQDESLVTYAAKITKAEGAVDWSLSAERIHNLVRGLQPWPLVSARMAGARVLLHRTELTSAISPDRPGTVVRAEPDQFDVVAGDGHILRIKVIQPEGRRAMSAREFLAGHHIPPGTRIERG